MERVGGINHTAPRVVDRGWGEGEGEGGGGGKLLLSMLISDSHITVIMRVVLLHTHNSVINIRQTA